MGFRIRKSFKVMPGVRMTLTPRGIGVSAGTRGARVSVHSSGRVTQTVGIPGTGLSYSRSSGGSSRSRAANNNANRTTVARQPAAAKAPEPGLFSPSWKKKIYSAVVKHHGLSTIAAVADEHPPIAPLIHALDATWNAVPAEDWTRAEASLQIAHEAGVSPSSDEALTEWGVYSFTIDLPIAQGVRAEIPYDRDGVSLLLAEVLQARNKITEAVDVVETCSPTSLVMVSLAELYAIQGRWKAIMELTDGVTNEDDATAYVSVQRGIALRELGYLDAAKVAFREALRFKSRPAEIRHFALAERAQLHLSNNKVADARKDLEKIIVEDSAYPGALELLESLSDPS